MSRPEPPEERGRPLFVVLVVVQALGFALLVGWLIWRATGG